MARQNYQDFEGLLNRLEDMKARKLDVLASEPMLEAVAVDGRPCLRMDTREGNTLQVPWSTTAGRQLANHLGIPVRYFRTLEETTHAGELARHLNYWFQRSDKKRLVRTIRDEDGGGHVRAYLSDRYRILDNDDVLRTALEAAADEIQKRGGRPEVFNWNLTEDHMDVLVIDTCCTDHLDAVGEGQGGHGKKGEVSEEGDWTGSLKGTIQDPAFERSGVVARMATAEGRSDDGTDGGDLVYAGCHLRNSETGEGGLWVRPCALRAVCDNRILVGQNLAQVHLGRQLNEDLLYDQDLIRKESQLVFEKVAGAVRATFNVERFRKLVATLRDTKKVEIPSEREAADLIVQRQGWTEAQRDSLLAAFTRQVSKDRVTAFDAIQAMTRAAQDFEAADPMTTLDMEAAAGELVTAGTKGQRKYFGVKVED